MDSRLTYLALNQYLTNRSVTERDRTKQDSLREAEFRVFSQNGEDGILSEILSRLSIEQGFFVEFGVGPGTEGNCVLLADILGWNGVFIESDPDDFAMVARKYQHLSRVATLHARVSPHSVEDLFASAKVPAAIDVLSIDVDGDDYWIWQALKSYRPSVVVIEYNSHIDPATKLVQPEDHGAWDGSEFFGASLGALTTLGERKGYTLVYTELAGVNAFFVANEHSAHFPDAPWQESMGPNYFLRGLGHPPHTGSGRYRPA